MTKYLPVEDVIRYKGQRGQTPVHSATGFGHLELVKFLIAELNFDPNITSDSGGTLLRNAAQESHLHVVKYLTEEQNCNPAVTDKN